MHCPSRWALSSSSPTPRTSPSCFTNIGYHLFADNKQVYTHVLPGEEAAGLHKLASCISELQAWCASRRLQMNAAKTELIWFGCRAALPKSSADRSLTVNSVVIHPIDVVRDLGVLLDSEVTMKPHINKLVSTCFYYLTTAQTAEASYVNRDLMKQLFSALILSRIDYCNSVLVGLPWSGFDLSKKQWGGPSLPLPSLLPSPSFPSTSLPFSLSPFPPFPFPALPPISLPSLRSRPP